MQFKVAEPLSTEQLRKLSWRLYGAFYGEPFFIWDDKSLCIEQATSYEDENEVALPNTYAVNLAGRYYGPEYERGAIHDHIAIAEWLEHNLSCQVFYGGDCDVGLNAFGPAEREVAKRHFYQHGHYPYQSFFKAFGAAQPPTCPRCQEPMNNVGGGGGDSYWKCYGCPNKMITGGGRSLLFRDEEFFKKHEEFRGKAVV